MEKTDNGIPISLGTALLSIVLICAVCVSLGLGAGFYFGVQGTRHGSELSSVSETCSAMVRAYEGRVKDMEADRGTLRARVAKYETFLVGTETVSDEAKKKLGVGGP